MSFTISTSVKQLVTLIIGAIVAVSLVACGVDEAPNARTVQDGGERLDVVATTSIVADVVQIIGGEQVEVTVLMPPGADPHSFEPAPRDVAAMADADAVFITGAGLEDAFMPFLKSAGETPIIAVSEGVDLRSIEEPHGHEEDAAEHHDEHDEGEFDPHVWFDPANVAIWARNIAAALGELDPDHAAFYAERAAAYQEDLRALDEWIEAQVAEIPAERRQLVVDHAIFGYFADRYGFEQIGAVIPGLSTLAEPSAQEIAALEDAILEHDVPAIFVGTTVNSAVAEQVAADTGTKLVRIYTDALGEPDGPAATYMDLMRYDVAAFVENLKDE